MNSSTAVMPPTITEIRRPNSFYNLFVDQNGNETSGSIAIPDIPDIYRHIESENK